MRSFASILLAILGMSMLLFADAVSAQNNSPPKTDDKKGAQKPNSNNMELSLHKNEKEKLEGDDLSSLFNEDLRKVPKFDQQIETKLNQLLKNAGNDPNALGFIFAQALDGQLLSLLNIDKAEVDNKIKAYQSDEVFSPVLNLSSDNSKGGKEPVDKKIIEQKKAEQQKQMGEAQAAISNLFSQVDNKMNLKTAIPSINFAPPTQSQPNLANIGADMNLKRVASDVKVDAKGNIVKTSQPALLFIGSGK